MAILKVVTYTAAGYDQNNLIINILLTLGNNITKHYYYFIQFMCSRNYEKKEYLNQIHEPRTESTRTGKCTKAPEKIDTLSFVPINK